MIGAIGSSLATLAVATVESSGASTSAGAAGSVGGTSGDSATISGPGKLFAALKELAAQNPTKFKEVAADIAAKLRAAAGDGTGDATGTDAASSIAGTSSLLSALAAKFDQAAQTGDVTVLQPAGGHHRHGAVGGYDKTGQAPPPPPDLQTTGGADLRSLFDSITKEVTDALAA